MNILTREHQTPCYLFKCKELIWSSRPGHTATESQKVRHLAAQVADAAVAPAQPPAWWVAQGVLEPPDEPFVG